jgi:hypothetical protein
MLSGLFGETCLAISRTMRVAIGPGQMAFTRMPSGPTSPAATLVSPITACFEAT